MSPQPIANNPIPVGSSIYYSLRFMEPDKRQAISALYAFSDTIETLVKQRQIPEVVPQKLAWWQEELARLAADRPSHPLTQKLAPILQHYQIPAGILTEILAGISKRLANPSYANFKIYSEQHYRAISSFPLLVALVTIPPSMPRPLLFVHDLGIVLHTVETIHELRYDLSQGYLYLPEEDLAKYAIDETALLALKNQPTLAHLLKQLAEQARKLYQQALAKLDPSQHFSQLPTLILARLYLKLLDEIEKDDFKVLERQIFIPPLRKLWLAWLTYLKFS